MNNTSPNPPPALADRTLRIVPLGGLGEFGKNMMALEYEGDMILVDCGQMFPEEEMLGVDSVIPDFGYVDDNLDKVRGMILTHGHEDHIGAIPYFLRDFDVPVWGSPLTLALVRQKLREMDLEGKCELTEVGPSEKVRLGHFEVEFIHMTHSIPETMALAIKLPIGTIVHTGDYKFDDTQMADRPDYDGLARLGKEGVLALLADSTNADREGHSPPEQSVVDGLRPIIKNAEHGIILSTFASGLHRLQTVLTLAEELGRVVGLAGMGLERNFATATKLNLLKYPEGLVVSLKELSKLPRNKRLLMATGSQGEPEAVLSRLARDDYRGYSVEEGDTVIFSARIIPGNDRAIYRTINHLCRRGAKIVTERDARVHASGHAYRDEMRQMIDILKPKVLAPIHGELRNLMSHRDLALSMGYDPRAVIIMDNGDALDLTERSASAYRAGLSGQVLVDGKVFDQLEEVVLRDRKHLSEDGMVIAIMVIDQQRHRIIAGPDIVTRGFIEVDGNEDLIRDCKEVVIDAFESCRPESREEWDVVKAAVRKALRKFLKQETDRYPVILPVVIEI